MMTPTETLSDARPGSRVGGSVVATRISVPAGAVVGALAAVGLAVEPAVVGTDPVAAAAVGAVAEVAAGGAAGAAVQPLISMLASATLRSKVRSPDMSIVTFCFPT